MPTGYTHGIIDGDITTFKEFATLCIRAFGVALHLRDEPFSVSYSKRVASSYHKKRLIEAKKELTELKAATDGELTERETERLTKGIEDAKKGLIEKREKLSRIQPILHQALAYSPPTENHESIKAFMIEQLESTIDADCDTDYYDRELERCEKGLLNINPKQIREGREEVIQGSIDYHSEHMKKENNIIEDNNEWADKFFQSIEETN